MKYILLLISIFTLAGCDEGIAPVPAGEKTGFSGSITFSGEWPDTVQRTHLVVFRDPLLSAADFNILNLSYVGPGIPSGVEVFDYNSNDSALVTIGAGTYSYVAVAQSTTPEVVLERWAWYVVGVYYANGDSTVPGKLVIPENTLVKDINIHCDFNNLPPQPPGG